MSENDKCQIRQGNYFPCKCDGTFPHAPGWEADVEVYAPNTNPTAFDHIDRLNDDGTVTIRMAPSSWHVYNIAPDTYQIANGDSWCDYQQEFVREHGLSIFGQEWAKYDQYEVDWTYDCFNWTYDHAGIVRSLAEALGEWIHGELEQAGLPVIDLKVVDTWSPQFYNFTTDGFELELTVDPVELRELTPDFDVDKWARDHYRSYDGFISYVTGRMEDQDWHAEYDGAFRIEYLLSSHDHWEARGWIEALIEAEWDAYEENVTIEPNEDRIREAVLAKYEYMDSGYTEAELREWAKEYALPILDRTLF